MSRCEIPAGLQWPCQREKKRNRAEVRRERKKRDIPSPVVCSNELYINKHNNTLSWLRCHVKQKMSKKLASSQDSWGKPLSGKQASIALWATAYKCYKWAVPRKIPPHAVCRYRGPRGRLPALPYPPIAMTLSLYMLLP